MTSFIEAMTNWNMKKDSFVNLNLEKGLDKAPRKNIFITIPTEFEEEIKDFIKQKRKYADSKHNGVSAIRKTELMLEFESNNPPPKRSDYE